MSDLQPSGGYYEVNEVRMIWWTSRKVRGARISLKGQNLELLVHNDVLKSIDRTGVRASMKMHDKNPRITILKAGVPDELEGLVSQFASDPY